MKIMGAGLIMLAVSTYVLLDYMHNRAQAALFCECAQTLERIAGELYLRMDTLENTFMAILPSLQGKTRLTLEKLTVSITKLGENSFRELWAQCWYETVPELGKERLKEIQKLGEDLGGFDTELQKRKMLICAGELRRDGEMLRSQLPQKLRLSAAVSMSLGAMAVILLV